MKSNSEFRNQSANTKRVWGRAATLRARARALAAPRGRTDRTRRRRAAADTYAPRARRRGAAARYQVAFSEYLEYA